MENYPDNTKPVFPYYVNWEVTNRCNMGCGFCFLGENPDGTIKDMDAKKMKCLIDILADKGVKMLNYAGGEPLLRKDIIELISYGKSLGLTTILSTNGILLTKELMNDLEGILDWISLPIDGPTPEVHDSVRGRKGHYDHIIRIMDIVGKSRVKMKINTMLCKKNIDYALNISELLDNYNVKKWKLFQFSARGKAKNIRDEYEISENKFLFSGKNLGTHAYDIIMSTSNLRDYAYFLIGTDATVSIPAGEEYIYIGSILSQSLDTGKIFDYKRNMGNAEISYGEK